MQCREFEEGLNRLLDERRAPEADASLIEHAATCEPCRQLFAGQRVLLSGLRQRAAVSVSADFSRRVLSTYQTEAAEAIVLETSSAARRAWQLAAMVLATAAALAVGVSIYLASQPGQPATVAANPPLAVPHVDPGGNLASGNLAGGKGVRRHPAGGLSLYMRPSGGYGMAIADMASQLPEAVERMEEVERYAPGIRPIRISFAMLWDAFWRTLPGAVQM